MTNVSPASKQVSEGKEVTMPMHRAHKPHDAGPPSSRAIGRFRKAHAALDAMLTRVLADEEIRFTYQERERRLVWNQGEIIPGLDPAIYRKCARTGAVLCYGHLGHAHLRSGWDYGYVYPPEWGGLDCLSNLLPEQCEDYVAVAGERARHN